MTLTYDDVLAASNRLERWVVRTPLVESPALNEVAKCRVFVKAEVLQNAGAFKFRGAMNKILSLDPSERINGVIAFSSGNHGLAVSLAAAKLSLPAVVLMPSNAPSIKIRGARKNGADVILYDRERDDREAICRKLCEERGLVLIPPYDDFQVMAGAGTGALEAIRQLPHDAAVDVVAVNCSGGGLAAGWATTSARLLPEAKVVTVEPEGFDDMARSLSEGRRVANHVVKGSICDALLAMTPGAFTFEVLKQLKVSGVCVTDAEVRDAVNFSHRHLKLVVEPGGAAALAAVLTRKVSSTAAVLLILSGGNVDPNVYAECLTNE